MASLEHTWNSTHLISTEHLSLKEILYLFSHATQFKTSVTTPSLPPSSPLKSKFVVNIFLEPSTRTRVSFEIAAKRLGASVINISEDTSSLTKGESLRDTALNLKALGADMLIIRHPSSGAPLQLAKYLSLPIINAGDGCHAHPSQGLLDTYTLYQHFQGELKNKNILIVGDILHSRVARSDINVLKKFDANITLVAPTPLLPEAFKSLGVEVAHCLDPLLPNADAIILLRIQKERQNISYFPSVGEFSSLYGLKQFSEPLLKKDCVILHPGPINRGVEIDNYLENSLHPPPHPHSLILKQVENGVFIRMAILDLCYQHHLKHL